jgi:Peptidase family S41
MLLETVGQVGVSTVNRSISRRIAGLVATLVLVDAIRSQDSAANSKAAETLLAAIERDYSYHDRLGIDWTKRWGQFKERFQTAPDKDEFARITVEFLSAAEDLHIWIKDGNRTIGTHKADLRPNFNPRLLPKLMPQLKQIGRIAVVGGWPDGVRYVAFGTWDDRDPASMKKAIAAVKEAAEAKAPLIIDVRPNTGGNEIRAREVAAFFVSKSTTYGKHVTRSKGKDSPVQERVLTPDRSAVVHPGPCVVLMGPANMSSCESFLLMMRAAGCKLIGARSAGSSGNPKPHDLGNGLVMMLPSWRDLSMDGKGLEGVGVTPDVVVETKPTEFTTSDPVLAKALEHLRLHGK